MIENDIYGYIHDRDMLSVNILSGSGSGFSRLLLKNIWKIYSNPPVMAGIMSYYENCVPKDYDVIVAPEARALPLAGFISSRNFDFKPIIVLTKSNKFGPSTQKEYSRGYSPDEKTMIHLYDCFSEQIFGRRVLFVDDGLASGGTILACVELIKERGGEVIGVFTAVRHHYCQLVPEYEEKYLKMTYTCYDI